MSMITCSSCRDPIDTDTDVECDTLPDVDGHDVPLEQPLCPRCRIAARIDLILGRNCPAD